MAEVLLPICSLGKSGDRRHWDESPSCSQAASVATGKGGAQRGRRQGEKKTVACLKPSDTWTYRFETLRAGRGGRRLVHDVKQARTQGRTSSISPVGMLCICR